MQTAHSAHAQNRLDAVVYVYANEHKYTQALEADGLVWLAGVALSDRMCASVGLAWRDIALAMLTHPQSRAVQTKRGPAVRSAVTGTLALLAVR